MRRTTSLSILACLLTSALFATNAAVAEPQSKFFSESKPMFDNCGDSSYADAVKNGITVGFSEDPPEVWLDQSTKQPAGVDWDINKAALDWMGVKNIKVVWMPWDSLIPSLLSKRIDVVGGDIHHTPARDKVISFTGPAFWYGPVIIVEKGNPEGIKNYQDLKGKKVGAVSGSAAETFLQSIGATPTPFKDHTSELQSVAQGRLDAVLDDDIIFSEFRKRNPNSTLVGLFDIPVPDDLIHGGGYGMARFGIRKEDCSLRAAYTQGLAEVRANGQVSAILRQDGMSDRNLVMFKLNP
ncbi:transporter substrate-binding domain-containing protein [Paraburkholderia sp. FT54]|uniref:substrate-binding periplasmic protein n=1 Tax=Paraburkholderia sp. FT54 TaxID=3074437 RepID=UPI0028773A27|nr:transporter substrate-binding domain-containing protein [Paraburkholderia sp. FT54]WNC94984.1 transporter substrate-binding domain-containing protein [Paraburkholderia sp. FT54]